MKIPRSLRRQLALHGTTYAAAEFPQGHWAGLHYEGLNARVPSWVCEHQHKYADTAYTCAARQHRRHQKQLLQAQQALPIEQP